MAAPAIGVQRRVIRHGTPKIDWSHPLAQGLMAAYRPMAGVGAVDMTGQQLPMTLDGNPTLRAGGWGPEMYGGATGPHGCKRALVPGDPLRLQPPFTFAWVGTEHGAYPSGLPPHFGVNHSDANVDPWVCYVIYIDSNESTIEFNNSGTTTTATTGSSVSGSHVYVAVMQAGSQRLFRDGGQIASNTSALTISYSGVASYVQMQWFADDPATSGTGGAMGCIWKRSLALPEISMFSTDPFCFLRR